VSTPVPAGLVERLRAAGCVFAEDEAQVLADAAPDAAALDRLVSRRVAGVPLEQVVGWAQFRGLRITVEPGVFIPRRRSEWLVETALRLTAGRARLVVLDLCAGTGALGAAFAAESGADVELHAAELDPAAVRCLQRNLPQGARAYEGDLFGPLPTVLQGRVDVLFANAPYVPHDELPYLPAEAREHEPAGALDGGGDGLDVHRRIAAGARDWLAPGGALIIETGERQRPVAEALLSAVGLDVQVVRCDDLDATAVVGTVLSGAAGRSAHVPLRPGPR
jgi:release factor glutamine methyltransferase